ncbi:MAG: hypothetical protein M1314_01510 [Firmicutes bacterium]|nr:hypothetical protein [Bacillota bacterium]
MSILTPLVTILTLGPVAPPVTLTDVNALHLKSPQAVVTNIVPNPKMPLPVLLWFTTL